MSHSSVLCANVHHSSDRLHCRRARPSPFHGDARSVPGSVPPHPHEGTPPPGTVKYSASNSHITNYNSQGKTRRKIKILTTTFDECLRMVGLCRSARLGECNVKQCGYGGLRMTVQGEEALTRIHCAVREHRECHSGVDRFLEGKLCSCIQTSWNNYFS